MLTISAASSTSRKTSRPVPSIVFAASLRDQHTLRGFLVEVAEERISPRVQWSKEHSYRAVSDHDLLAIELVAFELLGRRILVLDQQLDLLAARNREFGGL